MDIPDCVVELEIIGNSTEGRVDIIKEFATYHTNNAKIISITTKTKDKLNQAYLCNKKMVCNVGQIFLYENSVLNGNLYDIGIAYYLTLKRAINELNICKTYYTYSGDKVFDLKISTI